MASFMLGWLAGFIGIMFIFLLIDISVHFSVFGYPISKKTLSKFTEKDLDGYILNSFNTDIMHHPTDITKPLISIAPSRICKWYISKAGTVLKWSKYSKVIDKYHETLLINDKIEMAQNISRLNRK